VYPNKSKEGIFSVEVSTKTESNLALSLYDITGKTIYQTTPTAVKGLYTTKIGENLQLNSGIYLLNIILNNETTTRKLIVE
ncbi:MAG TPA: hypothetical protein DDZ41_07780, partial [Flavobacterium sp.]|nr:hypothetical protein [Flavobacterium sp.]